MPKPKYFFTLHRCRSDCSSHFEHIHLRVYDAVDVYSLKDELFTLRWQGDRESDHWYGFHLDINADGAQKALEQMKHAQPFVRRIIEANVNIGRPEQVIPALKIERYVRDDRSSEYLPLDKVLPADYQRWMSWMDGQCVLTTVAPDETSAAEGLLKAYATEIADGRRFSNYADKLEAWLRAGKPMRCDTHRGPPDIRPIEEILKPIKQPIPEVQPEQVAA